METVKGYELLEDVLARAHAQASAGKGKERHACDAPFHEQPMQRLCEMYGVGFAMGQAAKKSQESLRLPTVERQVAELLGAINYLAGAIIYLERQAQQLAPAVTEKRRADQTVNADEVMRDALVDAIPGGEAASLLSGMAWIEWDGHDECPFAIVPALQVMTRGGDVLSGSRASLMNWKHRGGSADEVIAYRWADRTNG